MRLSRKKDEPWAVYTYRVHQKAKDTKRGVDIGDDRPVCATCILTKLPDAVRYIELVLTTCCYGCKSLID